MSKSAEHDISPFQIKALITEVASEIWKTLPVRLDNPAQNGFAKVCFSLGTSAKDEEIVLVANEILNSEEI